MEVEKILDAGSGILNDVMTAVERNEFENLGQKIQSRVSEATSGLTGNGHAGYTQSTSDGRVYSGTVEPTNKRDGIYRTNYAENAAGPSGQKAGPKQADFSGGAYSSDAYRRYSSDRREGREAPNSSSRSRQQSSYQGNQSRAGYQKVYGSGNAYGTYNARPDQSASQPRGAYGRYDYNNPNRRDNLKDAAARAGADTQKYAQRNVQSQRPNAAGAPQRDFFAPTPFNSKNVSKSTGIVPMVFGSMGMAFGGVGTAMYAAVGALALIGSGAAAVGAGILAPLFGFLGLTGASGLLFSGGKKRKNVVEDYYEYGKYVGDAEFFNIKELAAKLGLQEKKLRKNLENMKRQGLLPGARLDDDQEMLLLTDKAYNQYRQAADNYKKRQAEDKKREQYFTAADSDGMVRALLSEGNEYLKKVRYYNDLIPDTQEMSNKLYRLENIMYRIFEQVKKKPETAQNLRKFMEYYLPTTEKLLSAYIEVDKQPQVGDNITNTKKEIESAMDTINDAFEKLLDSLFEDLAWDISSDISVMKTMLAQDGLTEGDMDISPEE